MTHIELTILEKGGAMIKPHLVDESEIRVLLGSVLLGSVTGFCELSSPVINRWLSLVSLVSLVSHWLAVTLRKVL